MSASFDPPPAAKELVPSVRLDKVVGDFIELDTDGDGKITLDEYLDHLLASHKAKLTRTFNYLDSDRDGTISFEEFLSAAEPSYPVLKQFRACDGDSDGLLSIDEAVAAAERLDLPYSTADIRRTIAERGDTDRDGKVSYNELFGLIARYGFQ